MKQAADVQKLRVTQIDPGTDSDTVEISSESSDDSDPLWAPGSE